MLIWFYLFQLNASLVSIFNYMGPADHLQLHIASRLLLFFSVFSSSRQERIFPIAILIDKITAEVKCKYTTRSTLTDQTRFFFLKDKKRFALSQFVLKLKAFKMFSYRAIA